jgi:hypothetical protein
MSRLPDDASRLDQVLARQAAELTQVPPNVRDSVMAAVLSSLATRRAAANAVEPEPGITRSKRSAALRSSAGVLVKVVHGRAGHVGADHGTREERLGVVGYQLLGDPQQGADAIVGQAVVDPAALAAGGDVAAVAQARQVVGNPPLRAARQLDKLRDALLAREEQLENQDPRRLVQAAKETRQHRGALAAERRDSDPGVNHEGSILLDGYENMLVSEGEAVDDEST